MRTVGGTTKVVDFGIAQAESAGTKLTAHGGILGTPAFMAPEQWTDRGVDARTDLYSLICTYYYLLTGRLPFEAATIPSIRDLHRYEPFPDARKLVPGLPEAVCRILARGSAKKPGDRYQDASALVRELDSLLAGTRESLTETEAASQVRSSHASRSGTARVKSDQAPARRWTRRDWAVAAGLVGVLAVLGLVLITLVRKPEELPAQTPESHVVATKPGAEEVPAPEEPPSVVSTPPEKLPAETPESHVVATKPAAEEVPAPGEPPSVVSTPPEKLPAQTPEPPRELTNSIGMTLVLIPAGEFMMGSPDDEKDRDGDEGPVHRVRITKPIYLGMHEVTQEQYERVMGENPSQFKAPTHPVEQVSWNDAVEFCRRLSTRDGRTYRLPTEAEWEYACRAGTTAPFAFGETLSSRTDANHNGDYPYGGSPKGPYRKETAPAGSYRANAWGLYDMHGNVFEWCQDWYAKDYYGKSPRNDPTGPRTGSYRVFRGGSWLIVARGCRSAFRGWLSPGGRSYYLGFRVASVPVDASSP